MLTNICGFTIDLKIKPVRAFNLRIQRDGSLSCSAPIGTSAQQIEEFISKHRAWIEKHVQKIRTRYEENQTRLCHNFVEGETFQFLGKEYPLHYIYKECTPQVSLTDTALCVTLPKDKPQRVRQTLINSWYARQLQQIINEFTAHYLTLMHEKPLAAVRYKLMTSRWGSCDPVSRILCFNLRLIFYPRECIELVVVHELCHLKEPLHNAHFHALMRHYLPDYKERDKRLYQ